LADEFHFLHIRRSFDFEGWAEVPADCQSGSRIWNHRRGTDP